MIDYNTFLEAAISAISGEVVKECISGIKDLVQNNIKRTSLLFNEQDLENNIIDEVRKTSKWAYYDLFENKSNSGIQSRYVPLDLLLTPYKERISVSEQIEKRSLKEIIAENKGNTVILVQPGSGKTTSVKYLVNSIFQDDKFLKNFYRIPIVIRLRELNATNGVYGNLQSGGIFEKLSLIFGLKFKINHTIKQGNKNTHEPTINTTQEDNEKLRILLSSRIIPYILDQQKILLILDGFDEIIDSHIKNLVISEIQELNQRLGNVNFILTSRTSDYGLALENTHVYEISELNENQIKDFSYKWFENESISQLFVDELKTKLPYKDFYRRPLLLTQLAILYGRSNEIPGRPNEIYNRVIELILRDWNEKQGLKRSSKYAAFNVEAKRVFLSAMAYKLSTRFYGRVYSRNQLYSVYKELHIKFPELPTKEVKEVIAEIETHNGLIIQSAYDMYEFSHLTFQEFLTAEHISHSSSVKTYRYEDLIKLPNELAIAIARSNDPYLFLTEILEIMLKGGLKQEFFAKLFNRIQLEKPRFEKNSLSLIAVLNLYTKVCVKYGKLYKAKFITENYPAKERRSLENIEFLDEIIHQLQNNDTARSFSEFYAQKEERLHISDLSFLIYDKIPNSDNVLGYTLPKVLYIRKSN